MNTYVVKNVVKTRCGTLRKCYEKRSGNVAKNAVEIVVDFVSCSGLFFEWFLRKLIWYFSFVFHCYKLARAESAVVSV